MIYELHGIVNNYLESDRLIAAGPDLVRLNQIRRDMMRLGYKRLYIKAQIKAQIRRR